MDIEPRLFRVFESVFGAEYRTPSDDDGPHTIPTWDSVNHLHLVLALESEFDVRFETAEIPGLLSVGRIRTRLASG